MGGNNELADLREQHRKEVKKLQHFSASQTAILRACVTDAVKQRDAAISELLALLRTDDVPDELANHVRSLFAQTENIILSHEAAKHIAATELKVLRDENEALMGELEKAKELKAKLAKVERHNEKLLSLLREVREEMARGGTGAAVIRGASLPLMSPTNSITSGGGGNSSVGGSVPEEEYLKLREKYDTLKVELKQALLQLQAEAVTLPPPPPPPEPVSFMTPEAANAGVGRSEEISALQAEVEQLKQQLEARENHDGNAEIALMAASEIAVLKAAVEEAQAKAEKHKKAKKDMEKEKEELMDALAQEIEELENKKDQELKAVKKELKALRKANAGARTSGALLLQQVQAAKASLAVLRGDVVNMAASIPKAHAEATHTLTKRLSGINREVNIVKKDYARELKERKRLFNLVQELRGNIRVFCRCRPPTSRELDEHAEQSTICVAYPQEDCIELLSDKGRTKMWDFDKVFAESVDQEQVYDEVSPLVTSVLDGYNVCIFAYGQTGTGKTYTMTGPPDNRGVNTRALEELFKLSDERRAEVRDDISVSILEIYNESIQDLLGDNSAGRKLEIRQGEYGNHVPDLTNVEVSEITEVLRLMQLGDTNRSSGCTNMNEHSSRSHSIMAVTVMSTNIHTGQVTRGKLNLIDLAGSERIGKSGATGQALKEAQNINRSLSALGDVIAARASKQAHVPYRNSTLTYLLQDSLASDSKTLMFVCISPVVYNVEESFCSLNFASRVRTVELGRAAKHVEKNSLSTTPIASPAARSAVVSGRKTLR